MAEKVFTSMGASLNGGNFLMPQEKWRQKHYVLKMATYVLV